MYHTTETEYVYLSGLPFRNEEATQRLVTAAVHTEPMLDEDQEGRRSSAHDKAEKQQQCFGKTQRAPRANYAKGTFSTNLDDNIIYV